MSNNPHRCVIDSNGNYVTFALLIEKPDGNAAPYAYTMQPGEMLIEASPPDMLKPKWNGSEWEETASPEEIAAAAPTVSEPTLDPITELQLAIAELYEEVLSRG